MREPISVSWKGSWNANAVYWCTNFLSNYKTGCP